MKTTHIPPYEEWAAILAENRVQTEALHRVLGESTVQAVRREVVEAARLYTKHLGEVAQRVGIELSLPAITTDAADRPIVMAGHQPVLYHAGLLEKVTRLVSLSQTIGTTAINVTIDTDVGDGGRILWSLLKDSDVVIKQSTLSEGGGLYRDQHVISKEGVARLFAEVCRDLESSGKHDSLPRVERVSKLYEALAGESISTAHSIVRMSECGARYAEVPLSVLVQLPTFQAMIQGMFDDVPRLVSTYNATLEAYRREHGIKNQANPFPNMSVNGTEFEMPFWEIVEGARKAVTVDVASSSRSLENKLIAPRGSIVTLMLRGVCSDLFIHGLGGGKYDQFVDAFAQEYWGAPLPRFVVASATRYLFPHQVDYYLRARELKGRYKEMVSHTNKFLGQGIFSEGDEAALAPLVERRRPLVEELQRASSNAERSPVAHALNEINREIKGRIDTSSIGSILNDGGIDDARLGRWMCREYPFFF